MRKRPVWKSVSWTVPMNTTSGRAGSLHPAGTSTGQRRPTDCAATVVDGATVGGGDVTSTFVDVVGYSDSSVVDVVVAGVGPLVVILLGGGDGGDDDEDQRAEDQREQARQDGAARILRGHRGKGTA